MIEIFSSFARAIIGDTLLRVTILIEQDRGRIKRAIGLITDQSEMCPLAGAGDGRGGNRLIGHATRDLLVCTAGRERFLARGGERRRRENKRPERKTGGSLVPFLAARGYDPRANANR